MKFHKKNSHHRCTLSDTSAKLHNAHITVWSVNRSPVTTGSYNKFPWKYTPTVNSIGKRRKSKSAPAVLYIIYKIPSLSRCAESELAGYTPAVRWHAVEVGVSGNPVIYRVYSLCPNVSYISAGVAVFEGFLETRERFTLGCLVTAARPPPLVLSPFFTQPKCTQMSAAWDSHWSKQINKNHRLDESILHLIFSGFSLRHRDQVRRLQLQWPRHLGRSRLHHYKRPLRQENTLLGH